MTCITFQNLIPSSSGTCSICLDKTQDNEKIIGHKFGLLFGQHEYHLSCITSWFEEGRDICPVCNIKVSNANQYLPSLWKKVGEILKSGILTGTISGIIREACSIATISDEISFIISVLTIVSIQLKTKFNPKLSEVSKFMIKTGIICIILASTVKEIPGFEEIALMSGIMSTTTLSISWFLRERGIVFNLISSGLSFGLSAIATKITRSVIIKFAELF